MPKFSKRSLLNIGTCQPDLQLLAKEVVKTYDCACIFGHRTPEQQLSLYSKGRALVDGEWIVINPREIVTYCDGTSKLSDHNIFPSEAIDLVPCIRGLITWNACQCYHFAGFVTCKAEDLFKRGKITHRIVSGADWDQDRDVNDHKLRDLVHFKIINE